MKDPRQRPGACAAAAADDVRIIVLLAAAGFASAANMRITEPLLPLVSEAFATTPGKASFVVSAFTIGYGLFQLVWGAVGDRIGKLRLVTLLTLATGLTAAFAAAADSLATLALARLCAGATAAGIIPLSMAHIGDTVAWEHRQVVLARYLSGNVLGVLAGQAAGALLGGLFGWRTLFVAVGGVFLSAGLALVAAGALTARRHPQAIPSLALLLPELLRRRRARFVLVAVTLEGAVFFGALAYIGAHLRFAYGLDYGAVGLLLLAFGLGGLGFTASVHRLRRWLGEAGLAASGGALLALGFGASALAPAVPVVALLLFLLGLGLYMLHNTLQTHATQMLPEARGLGVSVFASCYFVAQGLGVGLAGPVVDRFGYAPLFTVAGVACLAIGLGFAAALRARRGWSEE
ncbi:Inner membrane transport protein YnfM [bacterium HR40]|nr:Inner membrane transport protein YnfM [bacterium HR40]